MCDRESKKSLAEKEDDAAQVIRACKNILILEIALIEIVKPTFQSWRFARRNRSVPRNFRYMSDI